MYLFLNDRGQVLVTKSDRVKRVMFSIGDIEQDFKALTTSIRITPKPVVSVQGTIGGANYLNVFGEDPLQIEIAGVIVGYSCDSASQTESAIGNSVALYKTYGVINRVTPISFVVLGSSQGERQAFLVAMSITQDNSFADIAEFSMVLLAEDLNDNRISNLAVIGDSDLPVVVTPPPNTGVPGGGVYQNPFDMPYALSGPGISSSGNVVSRSVVNLTDDNLTPSSDSIR